jgi:hypothetical protein
MSLKGCEVVGWAMRDLLRWEDDARASETDGALVRALPSRGIGARAVETRLDSAMRPPRCPSTQPGRMRVLGQVLDV